MSMEENLGLGDIQPRLHTDGWHRSSSCRPAGCTGSGPSAHCSGHAEAPSPGRKALNHWAESCPVPSCQTTSYPAWRQAAASSWLPYWRHISPVGREEEGRA